MSRRRLDLVGDKFTYLNVISYVGNDKYGNSMFLCKCICGAERIVLGYHLKSGNTKSCGCYSRKIAAERLKRGSGKIHPAYGKKRADTSKKMSGKDNSMYGVRYFGKDNPMYGKKHSEETKQKISKNHINSGIYKGENNPNWKGGISCEPYCDAWDDKEYKDSIKERDNYQCQNPDCYGISKKLCLHHIDYNKKNCSPNNLITLCNSCNSRANYNREYWKKLYTDVISKV